MAEARGDLVLHCGGREVTPEELQGFKAPPPEGRWYPVSHLQVRNRVRETLEAAGFLVKKERLAVARQGGRFFGVMDLTTEVAGGGVTLAVGVRNSVDKSFPLGFCAGSRVFICDNLAFRSELLVKRKHTLHGERRFNQAIAEAVSRLPSFRDEEARRVRWLRETELTDQAAESLILRAWERGIVGTPQLGTVLKEWREPTYPDFRDRTAWSLLNAFTTTLKERVVKNPQRFVSQTMQLHHLLEFRRGESDVPQFAQAT